MQKYSVKLSGLKSERNLENNKYDLFVDVLNSKYKILYYIQYFLLAVISENISIHIFGFISAYF